MNISKMNTDISFISKMADEPGNDGMTSDELKAEFDKAGNALKDYINGVLVPAIEAINAGAVVMSADRPNVYPCLWIEIPSTGFFPGGNIDPAT